MKFLLLYDCIYPESLGGIEHRNHCLAQALAERGHQVTVAGWVKNSHVPPSGVEVLPIACRTVVHDGAGQRSLLAALRFAVAVACLDLKPYDVVETANIPYAHLFLLAFRCFRINKTFVVTWHEFFGSYWSHYKSPATARLYRAVEKLCVQVGHVNANSPLTGSRLAAARLGNARAPILMLPCGVWLRDIKEASRAPALDVPPLFYAGRLIPEKRLDLLLQAVAKLGERPMKAGVILLTVVGEGPDRPRLETMAASLGISDRVKFHGRIPEITDMWRLLAGTRIAVQPSAREGFGLFPLEAIALGRPVVTCESSENAIGAVVRDGIEGLCTAANPEALAAGLTSLLDDHELWSRMSANAARRAIDYDWPSIAERFEAFVVSVMQKSPERSPATNVH